MWGSIDIAAELLSVAGIAHRRNTSDTLVTWITGF